MILELSLMVVSVAVMIFIIVHKYREQKNGAKAIVAMTREKADPILRDFHQNANRVLSGVNLNNIVLFANKTFVFVVRFFMHASHYVHTISSSIVEKASQKKEDLTRSGAASFYFKQIKELKEKEEKPTETSATEEKM